MSNKNRNILLAALGGAVMAGLIASLAGNKKKERFPLSPSNDLAELPKTDPELTTSEPGTPSEMKEVMQQS
jgi:hypothetical protein